MAEENDKIKKLEALKTDFTGAIGEFTKSVEKFTEDSKKKDTDKKDESDKKDDKSAEKDNDDKKDKPEESAAFKKMQEDLKTANKTAKEATEQLAVVNKRLNIDPSKKSLDSPDEDKDEKNKSSQKSESDFWKDAGMKRNGRPLDK